ncbi:MAG: hypothetical protein ACKO6E_07210 [Planctomycetota bacterium]
MSILGIESIDAATGLLHLAAPSTYALARPQLGFAPDSIWIENTFAGLDGPGRWLFDPATRRIYVWPRGQTPGEDIVAPTTVELLRIEGRIDHDGPADTPVRGLVFRGLTFTHGLRYESAGLSGWGLQHDWERFDSPTALVRLRGAGILLAGYGPGLKDVNRDNEITRNHVHHVGRLWWHCIGIWAWQSGHNRIAHNHVHHVPYTGIAVTGRIGWDRSGQAECSRTVRWQDVGAATGGEPWDQRERFLHGWARQRRAWQFSPRRGIGGGGRGHPLRRRPERDADRGQHGLAVRELRDGLLLQGPKPCRQHHRGLSAGEPESLHGLA